MQSIWLSLLWKEWREYRWKLAVLTLLIFLPFLLALFFSADLGWRDWYLLNVSSLFCYGFLASIFVGMDVAAKENGNGTISFLQSLPMPHWKAAVAKLLVASFIVVVPIVLLMLVNYGLFRPGWVPIEFFKTMQHDQIGMNEPMSEPSYRGTLIVLLGSLSLLW